jgi:hypothetical protein
MADHAEPENAERRADSLEAAVAPVAATPAIAEISAPMLDVHAPHEVVRTWKDFLIHIATIVIGLLIAIGLEQTVEVFHHRHQVAETRAALQLELDQNRRAYADRISEFHRQTAALLNNINVLRYVQQHAEARQESLPGILVWHAVRGEFTESAWKTAQQSNVTALMPQDEVRRYTLTYDRVEQVAKSFDSIWPAIVQARLYGILDSDPTHLTPAQLAEEMTYTKEVLVQHFAAAAALVQLNRADPSFTPALTKDELNEIMHVSDAEQDPKLAAAVAITNRRLPADAQIPLSQSKTKPESSPLPAQQDVEAVSKVAAPSNRNK